MYNVCLDWSTFRLSILKTTGPVPISLELLKAVKQVFKFNTNITSNMICRVHDTDEWKFFFNDKQMKGSIHVQDNMLARLMSYCTIGQGNPIWNIFQRKRLINFNLCIEERAETFALHYSLSSCSISLLIQSTLRQIYTWTNLHFLSFASVNIRNRINF